MRSLRSLNCQATTTSQRLELLSTKRTFLSGIIYDFSFSDELQWARLHNFFHLSPLTLCALTSKFNAEFLSSLPADQFDYICQTSIENHFRQWSEQQRQLRKEEAARQGDKPRDIINSWLVIHFPKDSPQTVIVFFFVALICLVLTTLFLRSLCCRFRCCCC